MCQAGDIFMEREQLFFCVFIFCAFIVSFQSTICASEWILMNYDNSREVEIDAHRYPNKKLHITAQNSSWFTLTNLDAVALRLDISNASRVTVQGRAQEAYINASNASKIDLQNLKTTRPLGINAPNVSKLKMPSDPWLSKHRFKIISCMLIGAAIFFMRKQD